MQFSLRSLILGVTLVALGMGAISFPSGWMASVVYSLYFGWLAFSLVGAFVRRGPNRAFWIGSFICGAMYYHVAIHSVFPWNSERSRNDYYSYPDYNGWGYRTDPASNGDEPVDYAALADRPDLITTKTLNWIAERKQEGLQAGQHVRAKYYGTLFPATVVSFDFEGLVTVAWDDHVPPQSQVRWNDIVADGAANVRGWTHKTGHSVFGLLFAYFGGWLAWGAFARKESAE